MDLAPNPNKHFLRQKDWLKRKNKSWWIYNITLSIITSSLKHNNLSQSAMSKFIWEKITIVYRENEEGEITHVSGCEKNERGRTLFIGQRWFKKGNTPYEKIPI